MAETTTIEVLVINFLKDYRDQLIGLDFTRESTKIVDCCDVLIDRLEKENE